MTRICSGKARRRLAAAALGLPLLLAGCGTGTPHLQRPLLIPSAQRMPPPIAAAEDAVAKAKAAGAQNVLEARYPLAKAEAFLLNAKEEWWDLDPTSIVEHFAGISLAAANEALAISRRQAR